MGRSKSDGKRGPKPGQGKFKIARHVAFSDADDDVLKRIMKAEGLGPSKAIRDAIHKRETALSFQEMTDRLEAIVASKLGAIEQIEKPSSRAVKAASDDVVANLAAHFHFERIIYVVCFLTATFPPSRDEQGAYHVLNQHVLDKLPRQLDGEWKELYEACRTITRKPTEAWKLAITAFLRAGRTQRDVENLAIVCPGIGVHHAAITGILLMALRDEGIDALFPDPPPPTTSPLKKLGRLFKP